MFIVELAALFVFLTSLDAFEKALSRFEMKDCIVTISCCMSLSSLSIAYCMFVWAFCKSPRFILLPSDQLRDTPYLFATVLM